MVTYGILIKRIPIIIANAVVLLCSTCILALKFYFTEIEIGDIEKVDEPKVIL